MIGARVKKKTEEAFNKLSDLLLEIKNSKNSKNDPAQWLNSIQKAILELENAKKELQSMNDGKSSVEIEQINKYIKRMNARLSKMASSFFEKDLETLPHEDEKDKEDEKNKAVYQSLKGLYLEHFPKEATEYYSQLLVDPHEGEKALTLLENILKAHPDNNDPINQTIHYLLANHFYRRLVTADADPQRACQHALQLNSNNPLNAELKAIVIDAAFYFEETSASHHLPEEMEEILLTSHQNPDAYQSLQKMVADVRKPVLFSTTPPDRTPSDETVTMPDVTLPKKLSPE